MAELVEDLAALPNGSHCVSFHVGPGEAADHAVSFLAGNPPGNAASFWVSDSELVPIYEEKLARVAPEQVGCVRALDHEQVERTGDRLRPVAEVTEFVKAHPEGVSGGADTITQYWAPPNVADHLEYEAWFDSQPRERSRFLCPYDLRRVPTEEAPSILRELGRHHSHVQLSSSSNPGVRLLQLFVFSTPTALPEPVREIFHWAVGQGYVEDRGPEAEFALTSAGRQLVSEWARVTSVDW